MTREGTTACPLCGSASASHAVTGYDRMEARAADYRYARCGECGLVFQDPLPAPDSIAGFYPDAYDPHSGGARVRRDKWINRLAIRYYYGIESARRSRALRALFGLLSGRVLRGMHPPRGANRVLDVGCAAGNLLQKYRDLGWSVKGIETSERACAVARARGLDVHRGTVHDAPFPARSFDLVVLSHVIEHVLEPDRFLARCAEFLAPGGLLTLATPNARGLGFGLYGSCWYPLDAPRHLMLFDPRTIRLLGAKAGLHPARVATLSEPRMLCESRHYARTQGSVLPPDLEERRRIVARSADEKREYRGFKRLVRPLVAASAWFERGDILEADFIRIEEQSRLSAAQ